MFHTIYHTYVLIQISHYSSSSTGITQMDTSDMAVKSSSSSSITQMDTASDMTVKSTNTGDTTSGKQNLLKNLAKNICMAKYSY